MQSLKAWYRVYQGSNAIISVWGAAGAPGRSTLAGAIAWALAEFADTRLIDADSYAPSQALLLGVDYETTPGLAFALKAAHSGNDMQNVITDLDIQPYRKRSLKLHAGLLRTELWKDLTTSDLPKLLQAYKENSSISVFDLAAEFDAVENAKEMITAEILKASDTVIAVCDASELGVLRFIRGFTSLREKYPDTRCLVILNRVQKGMNKKSSTRFVQLLEKYGSISVDYFLPFSPGIFQSALEFAEPITLVDPQSKISQEVTVIARRIFLQIMGKKHD